MAIIRYGDRVLRVTDPLRLPFIFEARYTRAKNISDWDSFFDAVEREFRSGLGVRKPKRMIGSRTPRLIKTYQMKEVGYMIMWLRHLVAGKNFSRGDQRAIEELLNAITWYAMAGEQKFFDRYWFWLKNEHFTTDWRWRVTEHLREKFRGEKINPMRLNELPENIKKVGKDFVKKKCKNPLKVETLIKELFSRKLKNRLTVG